MGFHTSIDEDAELAMREIRDPEVIAAAEAATTDDLMEILYRDLCTGCSGLGYVYMPGQAEYHWEMETCSVCKGDGQRKHEDQVA